MPTMARRNCVRKGNTKQPVLKRQNAHETLPSTGANDAPMPMSDAAAHGDATTVVHSADRDSAMLEFAEGSSEFPDPALLDNDDDDDGNMTVIGDIDMPSSYSVIWKNRVYRIPDDFMLAKCQHEPECVCVYCRLVYPKDGTCPVIVDNTPDQPHSLM